MVLDMKMFELLSSLALDSGVVMKMMLTIFLLCKLMDEQMMG